MVEMPLELYFYPRDSETLYHLQPVSVNGKVRANVSSVDYKPANTRVSDATQ